MSLTGCMNGHDCVPLSLRATPRAVTMLNSGKVRKGRFELIIDAAYPNGRVRSGPGKMVSYEPSHFWTYAGLPAIRKLLIETFLARILSRLS